MTQKILQRTNSEVSLSKLKRRRTDEVEVDNHKTLSIMESMVNVCKLRTGRTHHEWKTQWMVLYKNKIVFFNSEYKEKIKNVIFHYTIRRISALDHSISNIAHWFEIVTTKYSFVVHAIHFRYGSEILLLNWLIALHTTIDKSASDYRDPEMVKKLIAQIQYYTQKLSFPKKNSVSEDDASGKIGNSPEISPRDPKEAVLTNPKSSFQKEYMELEKETPYKAQQNNSESTKRSLSVTEIPNLKKNAKDYQNASTPNIPNVGHNSRMLKSLSGTSVDKIQQSSVKRSTSEKSATVVELSDKSDKSDKSYLFLQFKSTPRIKIGENLDKFSKKSKTTSISKQNHKLLSKSNILKVSKSGYDSVSEIKNYDSDAKNTVAAFQTSETDSLTRTNSVTDTENSECHIKFPSDNESPTTFIDTKNLFTEPKPSTFWWESKNLLNSPNYSWLEPSHSISVANNMKIEPTFNIKEEESQAMDNARATEKQDEQCTAIEKQSTEKRDERCTAIEERPMEKPDEQRTAIEERQMEKPDEQRTAIEERPKEKPDEQRTAIEERPTEKLNERTAVEELPMERKNPESIRVEQREEERVRVEQTSVSDRCSRLESHFMTVGGVSKKRERTSSRRRRSEKENRQPPVWNIQYRDTYLESRSKTKSRTEGVPFGTIIVFEEE